MNASTFLRSLSAHDEGFVCGWHGLSGCTPARGQDGQAWVAGRDFGAEMRARYGK